MREDVTEVCGKYKNI